MFFVFPWGIELQTFGFLRMFSLSHVRDKTKSIFLYFFTKLKTYYLSYFYLLCFCLVIWSDLLNLTSLEFCVPLISFWNGVSAKTTGKTIIIITTLFTCQRDLTLHAANWGTLKVLPEANFFATFFFCLIAAFHSFVV